MCFYKTNRWLWSIFLMVCISMPSGCQSVGQVIDSNKVRPGHLLLIPRQGPLHIIWEARQLTIAFKGRVDQSVLSIEGNIDITGGGTQKIPMLEQLLVSIYFTKPDGSVLKRDNFYSWTQSTGDDMLPYTFTHRFELPKGTTHIAFEYAGTARQRSSGVFQKGDTVEDSFWHSPFR